MPDFGTCTLQDLDQERWHHENRAQIEDRYRHLPKLPAKNEEERDNDQGVDDDDGEKVGKSVTQQQPAKVVTKSTGGKKEDTVSNFSNASSSSSSSSSIYCYSWCNFYRLVTLLLSTFVIKSQLLTRINDDTD